jgi:hypothetical protein
MSRVFAEVLTDCRGAVLARTEADGTTNRWHNSDGSEAVADREETKPYVPHIIAAFDFMDIRSREDSSSTRLRQRHPQWNGVMTSKTPTRQVRQVGRQRCVPLKAVSQQLRWWLNVSIGPHGDEFTQSVLMDPVRLSIVFELMILFYGIHVPGLREEPVDWSCGGIMPEILTMSSGEVSGGFAALRVLGAIPAAFGAVENQGRGSPSRHCLMRSSLTMGVVRLSIVEVLMMLIFRIHVPGLREELGALRDLGAIHYILGGVEDQRRGSLARHTMLWISQTQS